MYDDLDQLRAEDNPQRRGKGLESVIARLFEQAGFEVQRNAGTARPRQTDLFATDGPDNYLIEVKWTSRPTHVGAIAGLRDRLGRTAPTTVGVLVSMSGFGQHAIAEAEVSRHQPMLLLDGKDLGYIVDGRRSLRTMLADKRQGLVVHGRAVVGETTSPNVVARVQAGRTSLATARSTIVGIDGIELPWIIASGGYEPSLFVQDLPDVDWVPTGGHGVLLDIDAQPQDQASLIEMVERLASDGWVSNAGSWRIRQASTNWHGVGGHSLIDAIKGWEQRYADLDEVHHTEEIVYAGACDGGLFRLAADVSADKSRVVWHANIGLQLVGVPVNGRRFEKLCLAADAEVPTYFRPLSQPAITSNRPPRDHLIPLEPIAYVTADTRGSVWATGLVAKNPLHESSGMRASDPNPAWWPDALRETEILVCDLRHHHLLADRPMTYQLWSVESTWLADTLIARVRADWPRPRFSVEQAPRITPSSTTSTLTSTSTHGRHR